MIRSFDPSAGAETLPTEATAPEPSDVADESLDSIVRGAADAPAVDVDLPLLLHPGDLIGGFRIESKIGAGGMGIVYRAYDPELERPVAIKLHRGFGRGNATTRLLREAKSMARLSHPNVLTVYEVGTHGDHVFIAMEFAEGGSLRDWLLAGDRTWQQIVDIFADAGRGLAAAHDLGLVHRDFKADNVLLDTHGRARVADFGLARAADSESAGDEFHGDTSPPSLSSPSNRLTTDGRVVGTPSYMPPEQYGAGVAAAAADQFAFCASLYEALYGQSPFEGKTLGARLSEILADRVREPPSGRAPARLFPILARGLASDPDARFPSMRALLAKLTHDPNVRRRRIAAGVALVGTTAAAVWLATAEAPPDPCAGAKDEIEAVWNDERRVAIATAFERIDDAAAVGARDEVLPAIDAFAATWTDTRVDACEATRVRGDQSDTMLDLRTACLDRHLATVDGIARVLEHPDAAVIAKISEIADRLPALDGCNDTEALARDIPPPDPAAVAEVAKWRAALSELDTRVSTNVTKGALPQFEALAAQIDAIGYPPLHVEVSYQLGRLRELVGEYEGSIADYDDALTRAIEVGYEEYVPRAAAKLAFVLGVRVHEPEGAARVLRIARAAERRRPATATRMVIEGVAATLARERGDLDEAVAAAKRSLALQIELADGDETEQWSSRMQYAIMLDEQGQTAEANREFDRTIELLEGRYGPDDARLLSPLRAKAVHYVQRGDSRSAQPLLERRARLAERAHGSKSLVTVRALRELAHSYASSGAPDRAAATLDRALEIYAALPERDPTEHGELLATKAISVRASEGCKPALEVYALADAVWEEGLGPGSDPYATSLITRLRCVSRVEGPDAAWTLAQHMLELKQRRLGPGATGLLSSLVVAAEAANDAEHPTEAIELLERGLAIVAKQEEPGGRLASILLENRGDALVKLGRSAEAEADYRASVEAIMQRPPVDTEYYEALRTSAERLYHYPDSGEIVERAYAEARRILLRNDAQWAREEAAELDQWRRAHPAR
jgi:tetratricopeptide (TPR) repeat protein